MQTMSRTIWLPCLLLTCSLFFCIPQVTMALEVPPLSARVNDYASILTPATKQQLMGSLTAFENEQSTQIAVLTIPSLKDDSLEAFSIRVAEAWKIGHQGLDNGAILLVAKNERKIRIEVGYGLEGTLTDLTSGRIISDIIVPHFKQGDFDGGVLSGVSAMMDAVRGEFNPADLQKSGSGQTDTGGFIVMLLALLVFVGKIFRRNKVLAGGLGGALASAFGFVILGPRWLIIMLLFPAGIIGGLMASQFTPIQHRTGRKTHRSGGVWGSSGSIGGSGGFGGGGGGGFGGGGASGGW